MEFEISLSRGANGVDLPKNFLDPEAQPPPGQDMFCPRYRSVLCLDLMFKRVEQLVEKGEDAGVMFVGEELLRRVAKYPELRGPIEDMALLDDHRDILDLLMMFIIPAAEHATALFKFAKPFNFTPVYVSPGMQQLVSADEACYSFAGKMDEVVRRHQIMVGATILKKYYNVDIDIMPTAMLSVPEEATGLTRFYKPVMNNDYVEIVAQGDIPDLSRAQINRLLNNVSDTDLWLEMLPPECFAFHGVHLSHLHEVTEEEALSRLKHRLISRDAILDVERVRELAQLVRVHFRNPSLRLGLTAIDYPLERGVDHEYRIRFNLLSDNIDRLTGEDFAGSVYEKAFKSRQTVVIEDLRQLAEPTRLERQLLRLGMRSILIAPLLDQDRNVIGMVELGCPQPFGINAFLELKFREIRGLFRTAVERSREYIDNRIEAIMREQYTSLHASVEWKFTEAAFDILQQQERGETPVSPDIAFGDVYPLYGQADIVSSSRIRNASIYQDLVDNLRAGRFFLARAMELVAFPLINQVIKAIDDAVRVTVDDFDNGHEIRYSELIHNHISPLIHQLGRQHPELTPLSNQYFQDLDNDLGLFARNRLDYEKSVNRINRELSEFFSERDQAAQATLPHYYEKYKTDGVEYELYAGQSLLKNQEFSQIHLRNLRLSQLIDMADATRLIDRVSAELTMPLRTAQLIFAYTTPLDIRFRMDEKRFDVDGDYNVRYEILKKRIDKATIRNGEERLTLADHVSIVYLHDKDREEYLGYLDYLHQADYIDGQVEDLVLDPLQSVNGLRALRFKVRL